VLILVAAQLFQNGIAALCGNLLYMHNLLAIFLAKRFIGMAF
jgi:hypothetical protein